ncbi:MAG TPA: ABC transporter ATP-binding protein [Phycisphaerae bacterium]|nr:ABC transporter ATP-binding protein [Phycisphaerae bacterium]HOM50731.1 ABC transporter ATP-binding protein [Phycisphaerae bacterium]HPP26085.1 ABC transporter ATP-binding protein [Phycisphaerae bacterium]HPU26523.1 ABC transporter ATP-binding protein [Phycisphaerae bacterium]
MSQLRTTAGGPAEGAVSAGPAALGPSDVAGERRPSLVQRLRDWWNRPSELELLTEEGECRYRAIDAQLIRRLATYLRPYWRQYALGIALGLVMIVLEMQSPRFMGAIVNWTTGYLAGTLDPMPTESEAIRRIVLIVLLWAVVAGTALVLHRWSIIVMTDAGERVQFDLRRALFGHLQKLSMSFYDKTKLGRIISRCTSDVNSLREVNVWGIDIVAKNTVMMLVAGGMLLNTEPRLFLAVAWLGPILFLLNRAYRKRAAVLYQIAREGFTRVSSNLAENITGVRVVTAFNRQSFNLDVFDDLQVANTQNNVRAARANGLYQPLLTLVGFIGRAIILCYGGYLVAAGGTSRPVGVGSVVMAFLYWDWFMAPIVNFGNFYNQLMMAMAGAERIFTLLDTPPDVNDVPGAKPLPRVRGHVRFEHVSFGYKPDRFVLHDVDFEVQPGQMVALVGSTGSGKSSIISLLARFYLPQQGRILIDGHDIRLVTGESLHRQMGLVLQTNYLFTGTVLENIRYARPEASVEDVVRAAKALGTYESIASLAHGFDTEVGERGANMSLGQRQLICFTRAFLADPQILMLDEATSSVDTATELLIQRSLERLLAGRTTFVVAHRLSTIQRADVILVIDHGRIVERGTHWELLEADGRYAQLYQQFVMHND